MSERTPDRLERFVRPVGSVLFFAVALQSIYTAGFGLFDPVFHRTLVLAGCAVAVLLTNPLAALHAPRSNVLRVLLWLIDFAMIAVLALALEAFYRQREALLSGLIILDDWDSGVALAAVLVLLELTRRVFGLPIVVVGVLALLYTLFGKSLPWIFHHSGFTLEETMRLLWYSFSGIFGTPSSVMVGLVLVFITFGMILEGTGAGERLLRVVFFLTGRTRGGPAHAAVTASGLFGTMSGSIVANVVGTGTFTIPLIKRRGFTSEFAGAVETAASAGGQIVPPVMGVTAFLMAELTGIPYVVIAVAALMPALFYYGSIFFAVSAEAARLGITPLPPEERIRLDRSDIVGSLQFVVPILVIVGVLAIGRSPAAAGFWAIVSTVALGIVLNADFRGRPQRLIGTLVRAGAAGAGLMVTVGVLGVIIGSMELTGLGVRFANLVLSFAETSLLVGLVLTALACLVLGMGMPTLPAYLIIVLVLGPAMVKLGIPTLAIHLFVFYFGVLANVTPPVALAAYAAAPIAGANPVTVGLMSLRLASAGFVIPFVFAFNPVLLIVVDGFDWGSFVWIFVRLALSVWLLTGALAGFDRRPLSPLDRLIRAIAAVAILVASPFWNVPAFAISMIYVSRALPWTKPRMLAS